MAESRASLPTSMSEPAPPDGAPTSTSERVSSSTRPSLGYITEEHLVWMDDGKVAWAEALESETDSETLSKGHPPSAATPRDTPPPPMDVTQYMLTRPSTPSTYTLTMSQMSTLPRLLQSPTIPPSLPRKPTPLPASRTAVPPSTLHIPFPARPALAPTLH